MDKETILKKYAVFQKGLCCLSYLSAAELLELQQHKIQKTFKKGEIILNQKQTNDAIWFVLEGFVREYVQEHDRQLSLRVAQAGDFLNFSSVISNKELPFTAQAITEVTVCQMEKEFFTELLHRNSEMAFQMLHHYGAIENELFTLVRNNFFKQMNGKVATVLLYLNHFRQPNGQSICALLTRRELASFAGISMENLVRILKNWETDGLIRRKEQDIEILSIEEILQIEKNG